MGRRWLALVAAVLLAAVGTGLVFLYVNTLDQRVARGQQVVQVLVATGQIAAGTTARAAVDAGLLELRRMPRDAAAPGALSDIAPIQDRAALAPLFPGEQVLAAKFGAAAAVDALPIPPGKLAVSVQLSDPARVAGFVTAGSEVAVFLTTRRSVTGAAAATPSAQPSADGSAAASASEGETRLLLPRVGVLAAGPTTAASTRQRGQTGSTAGDEQVARTILTLAVDQRQAQKIVHATQSDLGVLYVALLRPDSRLDSRAPATDLRNLFN